MLIIKLDIHKVPLQEQVPQTDCLQLPNFKLIITYNYIIVITRDECRLRSGYLYWLERDLRALRWKSKFTSFEWKAYSWSWDKWFYFIICIAILRTVSAAMLYGLTHLSLQCLLMGHNTHVINRQLPSQCVISRLRSPYWATSFI